MVLTRGSGFTVFLCCTYHCQPCLSTYLCTYPVRGAYIWATYSLRCITRDFPKMRRITTQNEKVHGAQDKMIKIRERWPLTKTVI